jgi:ribose transport system substrate-binding protein
MRQYVGRTACTVLSIAAAAVVAAGCGGSSDSGSSNGGGGDSSAAGGIQVKPDDAKYAAYQNGSLDQKLHTELPCNTNPSPEEQVAYQVPKAKQRYKIALMEVTLAGYYYQGIAAGARKAAKEAGVDVDIVSSGQGYADPATQIQQADDVAQKGVDAVVLAPSDIQGSIPIVRKFVQDDKPVINISTEVASPDAYMVMQDDYKMGKISADEVARLVGPKGGAGIIIGGPANATWSRKRVAGFQDQVKEKYPNIEIIGAPTQNVDPSLGLKSFENTVQRHPEIDWIYTDFDFLLQPKSLPQRYRDVPFVTNGFDPTSQPDLESGRIQSIIGISPTAMGYMGVGSAVSVLNGDKVPALQCVPIPIIKKADIGSDVANGELIPPGYEK